MACIAAIMAFHKALNHLPKHPLMDDNRTPWGKVDRWCWGDQPDFVQPKLRALVSQLYALRRPVSGLKSQLIHGDLNPENILIAPGGSSALNRG
jgi:Ser/Thr protein kinase RdoA (MazF antagonist)